MNQVIEDLIKLMESHNENFSNIVSEKGLWRSSDKLKGYEDIDFIVWTASNVYVNNCSKLIVIPRNPLDVINRHI